MGGQLVIAGCHSNVLYDVLHTSVLQLHIKGVTSKTQSIKKKKAPEYYIQSLNFP